MRQILGRPTGARKATDSVSSGPAQLLRDALSAHGLCIRDAASIWGVSEKQAQRLLDGGEDGRPCNWARLAALPPPVLATWGRLLASVADGRPVRGLDEETLDVVEACGEVARLHREAMAAGVFDATRARSIRKATLRVICEAADLPRAVAG